MEFFVLLNEMLDYSCTDVLRLYIFVLLYVDTEFNSNENLFFKPLAENFTKPLGFNI